MKNIMISKLTFEEFMNKQKFEKLSPELTKKIIEKFDFLLKSIKGI